MPYYGPLPEHFGEKIFAESLLSIDDGRLHLFFDSMLPGVSNIDVILWDEVEGVFCLEVKAIPLEMVEEISLSEIVIQGRDRGRNPMLQARRGAFDLLSFLRETHENVPWLSSTVAWSKIKRFDWESHWSRSALPHTYSQSMIFQDDLVTLDAFRSRLRFLRKNAPFGSTEPKPFQHDELDLKKFITSIMGRAFKDDEESVSFQEVIIAEIVDESDLTKVLSPNVRERLVLDTDLVRDLARSLTILVEDSETNSSNEFSKDITVRIQEISSRLEQPFKLGIVGEMKAGKSSVLNGLLGVEIALTDALECTFCPQRVALGDKELARIHTSSGISEIEINALIDSLRAVLDESGHAGITSVECFLPAGILENIEIWDSPGFGGSDSTNKIAEQFIESVDAAIWVFNKDYMGQRQLDEILSGLQSRGKSIIGVVNKCENVSQNSFNELSGYLEHAYPGIQFSALIPFSAKLALSPVPNEGRDTLATDSSGNINLLLETIRSQIVSNPGRLSARAASGDLRAICFSVRDEIQKRLLDEKRTLYHYHKQYERGLELLATRFVMLRESLGSLAISVLSQELIDDGKQHLSGLNRSSLKKSDLFERTVEKCVSQQRINEILDEFFKANHSQIAESVRAAGVDIFEDHKTRLTEFERLSHSQWDFKVKVLPAASDSTLPIKADAAGVAVITGSALGAIALAIPGPQWPFVAVGVLVSYLASKNVLNDKRQLSDANLHSVRQNEWAKAINEYLDQNGLAIKNAVDKVLDQIHHDASEILRKQILASVLGSKSLEEQTLAVRKLEALRQGAEMLIEQLNLGGLELPARSLVTSGQHTIGKGNKSEAQLFIKRILSSSRDMLAVVDGCLSYNVFPLFLEANDAAAIRILAWQQPHSSSGEAFRLKLAELRSKRSGTVHVVAPVPVTHNVEQLPLETWLFVSGWAYKINVSLLDAWDANQEFQIESLEDDGSIYSRQFGRWFDDNVSSYQGIQV